MYLQTIQSNTKYETFIFRRVGEMRGGRGREKLAQGEKQTESPEILDR